MKIIEVQARIMKIMKFIEFQLIIENIENLIIPCQNNENHEIPRIPNEKN